MKRIVVNPLITTAPLLKNSTLRNNPIAKTSANINNENIDIANIASEAQLTDLQLTLMLSMANKYQWTPWKALLLADPTQHHDLVHASSVFDVLRDYIIDLAIKLLKSVNHCIYWAERVLSHTLRKKCSDFVVYYLTIGRQRMSLILGIVRNVKKFGLQKVAPYADLYNRMRGTPCNHCQHH